MSENPFITESERQFLADALRRERFGIGSVIGGGMMAYKTPPETSRRKQVNPQANFSPLESHILARLWLAEAESALSDADRAKLAELQAK